TPISHEPPLSIRDKVLYTNHRSITPTERIPCRQTEVRIHHPPRRHSPQLSPRLYLATHSGSRSVTVPGIEQANPSTGNFKIRPRPQGHIDSNPGNEDSRTGG